MFITRVWLRCALCASAVVVSLGLVFACSSSSSGNNVTLGNVDNLLEPNAGTCSTAGSAVLGPQDDHCVGPDGGQMIQVTTAEGCTSMAGGDDGGGGGDDGGGGDAGDIGNCGDNDYGATMYNNWGSDDDCKYDVEWQSTPICQNVPVYFTVIVTNRSDNTPLLGVQTGGSFVPANPRPDVVLDCNHPIPNNPAPRDPSPSVAPGTYVVGPIVFDQPGKWVFRFHFNEECLDIADDSPHGHAAFYINVP